MNACVQLQPGYKLGGYTIERLLGKGGMGAVYLVRDANGALFAAKAMMRFDKDNQTEWHKRFLKEASFAITVHHKNLVAVHDAGEDHGTGICYIIIDYIPGGSLSDLLKSKGRLDVREAVDIVIAIASALEVAHGLDIVHRDIKPENILFDTDGTPKLADMGIAKFSGPSGSTLTSTGMIIGTPAYMSPEQMMNSHMVDPRSDIYSLGLVMYEMLTGMRPHANSTVVELIAKAIKGEELPDIRTIRPEVSVSVAYVLSLMVAVKPENRPTSAKETAKMLLDAATSNLAVKCSQIKKAAQDMRINASITASEGQPRHPHRRPASGYNHIFSPVNRASHSAKMSRANFYSRKSLDQNSRNEATLLKEKLDAMYRQLTDNFPPDYL